MKLFVPGRVCLLGEHSDWAGGHRRSNPEIEKGYTLVCGTNQGIFADVEAHPTLLILSSAVPGGVVGPYQIPMAPLVLLEEAQKGGFWSYIAGVAYQVLKRYPVGGLVIHNDYTDLPIKKGLSSSAAICVLTARAFNQVYGLDLSVQDEMELAYLGEITTPSRCGRMDQACAFGSVPVLMTFDGDTLETEKLEVGADLHLVVVDLRAQKDTRKILGRLNECYPAAKDEIQQGVQELLGPRNRATVQQAVAAIARGDAAELGRLMVQAQQNFDRYAIPACPEELTAPVLHRVINYPELQPYIYGAKGVGSQGDGSAQFLTRSAADQQKVIDILRDHLNLPAISLTIGKNN